MLNDPNFKYFLDYVLKVTNDAQFANLHHYSKATGVSKQTAYNQVCLGTFPLETLRLGRTVVVRVVDLANFLKTGIRQSEPAPKKAGRVGAPRKYSQAQRTAACKEKKERAERRASQSMGVAV